MVLADRLLNGASVWIFFGCQLGELIGVPLFGSTAAAVDGGFGWLIGGLLWSGWPSYCFVCSPRVVGHPLAPFDIDGFSVNPSIHGRVLMPRPTYAMRRSQHVLLAQERIKSDRKSVV